MSVFFTANLLPGRSTLIFGSSLGADSSMWSQQIDALTDTWNTVAFDLPGHGLSPAANEPPSIDTFADHVISIADRLQLNSFSYCGLSIGGAVGQSLAARYPDRIESLVLAATGLTILSKAGLTERAERVLSEGMDWIADASVPRWFNANFRARESGVVEEKARRIRRTTTQGYADACRALGEFDGRKFAASIQARTLVISGADDIATPPHDGLELARSIRGAEYVVLDDASHLCNVEQPDKFTSLIRNHFQR